MKQASQPRPILEVALMRCCVSETPAAVAPLVVQPTHQVAPVAPVTPVAPPVQVAPAPTPIPAFTPKPAAGIGVAKTSEPIEPFLTQGDSPLTQDVKSKWPALLEQMNKVHVSLRAWLINGQVVAATPEAILVAFKNDIHRDTTEKDTNKAKIEEQMAVVFGKSYRLVTMMLRDWEKVAQAAPAVALEQPPLELLAMDEDGKSANGDRFEQEWITEAINLFGEDLVKIEENND
jgi:DNA polymerase-3 subunit gamma/tau